jgi:ABC-type branched-subunit amino acid transport system substrate-binding protein
MPTLNLGLMFPIFSTSGSYLPPKHNRLVGSLMAISEVNAARSGPLSSVSISYEVLDSRASSGFALQSALRLATAAFDGAGADLVVGPSSSSPALNSQLILKTYGIPQVAYSATSPDLSDDKEYGRGEAARGRANVAGGREASVSPPS